MGDVALDRIVGHRGLAGHAQENTLASIELAARVGLPAVEFDIRVSRDGQFILMHDETVDRTTNGQGRVDAMTLAELRALDAGAKWGREKAAEASSASVRAPTLQEAIDACGRHSLQAHVEVKFSDAFCAPFAKELRRFLRAARPSPKVTISSFSAPVIEKLQGEALPVDYALLIWSDLSGVLSYCAERGIRAVHSRWDLIDAAFVAEATERGIVVRAYTVNDRDRAARLLSLGVAQVISDTAFIYSVPKSKTESGARRRRYPPTRPIAAGARCEGRSASPVF